jgi:hypothetical protein
MYTEKWTKLVGSGISGLMSWNGLTAFLAHYAIMLDALLPGSPLGGSHLAPYAT